MNERDEFLRDRLRPGQPGAPAARPPGPQPNGTQTPPPAAFPPFSAGPAPQSAPGPPLARPMSQPPAPPVPSHQQGYPPPPMRPRPPAAHPAPGSSPPPGAWSDVAFAPPGRARPSLRPDSGWRRIIEMITFGLVRPGPSAAQREEVQFEAAIRTVLRGNHKVGVLGKGGVGKTSVAASVGSIFAELRRQDRIVAVDADTAFGRLASRIDPESTNSFWELTADKNLHSYADVMARVGRNTAGLHVLGGEPAAGPRRVLDPAIYREAALRLDRHFTISVIDCGSTMDAPVTQEVLRDLDALIVVSSPWADGASAAAKTMDWLADHNLRGLLQRTIVVLNDSDGHADKRTRSLLAREFINHGQPVVEVPFDPHLRPGGVIDVSTEMAPATRLRFLQIAATVTGYFASRPPHMRNRPSAPR
jgi:MinD-like ATPase involved in chromosome partitioning or flagellar assembly